MEELGAKYVGLTELLQECDYISLHCPLTEETRHLIGRRELEKMKKTAILINTARGPVVDERRFMRRSKTDKLAEQALMSVKGNP